MSRTYFADYVYYQETCAVLAFRLRLFSYYLLFIYFIFFFIYFLFILFYFFIFILFYFIIIIIIIFFFFCNFSHHAGKEEKLWKGIFLLEEIWSGCRYVYIFLVTTVTLSGNYSGIQFPGVSFSASVLILSYLGCGMLFGVFNVYPSLDTKHALRGIQNLLDGN